MLRNCNRALNDCNSKSASLIVRDGKQSDLVKLIRDRGIIIDNAAMMHG